MCSYITYLAKIIRSEANHASTDKLLPMWRLETSSKNTLRIHLQLHVMELQLQTIICMRKCVRTWWAWVLHETCYWEGCGPEKKLLQVPGLHGTQKAKEPIHLKQEVVLWTFPDKQSRIPSRNVLDATKHISRYWEPGFRKQYSIVEGDPWQSLNHHPTRSSGYFDVWDIHSAGWGNGCSHPAFQKNGSRLEIYVAHMVWQEWFIYCAESFSVT